MNPDLIQPGSTQATVQPIVSLTKPFPATKAPSPKCYVCTVLHASLHRKDGKKLPFVGGFLETDILHDQLYLDEEIASGNNYIREAGEREIFEAHMRRDPRKAMEDKVRGEVEAETARRYEAQIRELQDKLHAITPDGVVSGSAEASNADGVKLEGAEAIRAKLAASQSVKTGTATVIMTSEAAPLKGITGTAQIAAAAVASNQK